MMKSSSVGDKITISTQILSVHPKSSIAGLTLPVVELTPEQKDREDFLGSMGERTDLIPVQGSETIYYVEPEYCIEEYSKKHLIAHLVDAGEWDKIEEFLDDPVWGEEAKKALGRHN